jgi:hypothetical protein
MTRLQNLFFTLIPVGGYAAAIGAKFAEASTAAFHFPPFDSGALALLTISHAGYLVGKAVPKPQQED